MKGSSTKPVSFKAVNSSLLKCMVDTLQVFKLASVRVFAKHMEEILVL